MRIKYPAILLLLILLFCETVSLQAQPGGGGDPGGGEPVPFQGIWMLIAAGVAVAVKSLWPKNKTNS